MNTFEEIVPPQGATPAENPLNPLNLMNQELDSNGLPMSLMLQVARHEITGLRRNIDDLHEAMHRQDVKIANLSKMARALDNNTRIRRRYENDNNNMIKSIKNRLIALETAGNAKRITIYRQNDDHHRQNDDHNRDELRERLPGRSRSRSRDRPHKMRAITCSRHDRCIIVNGVHADI